MIEFRGVISRRQEDDKVSITVRQAYVTGPEEARTDALYETWKITVYDTPDDYFLFDVESVQECASDLPLEIDEYYYGGMAFRGSYEWFKEVGDNSINPGDLKFITSEGKDRWEGNHSRPTWGHDDWFPGRPRDNGHHHGKSREFSGPAVHSHPPEQTLFLFRPYGRRSLRHRTRRKVRVEVSLSDDRKTDGPQSYREDLGGICPTGQVSNSYFNAEPSSKLSQGFQVAFRKSSAAAFGRMENDACRPFRPAAFAS